MPPVACRNRPFRRQRKVLYARYPCLVSFICDQTTRRSTAPPFGQPRSRRGRFGCVGRGATSRAGSVVESRNRSFVDVSYVRRLFGTIGRISAVPGRPARVGVSDRRKLRTGVTRPNGPARGGWLGLPKSAVACSSSRVTNTISRTGGRRCQDVAEAGGDGTFAPPFGASVAASMRAMPPPSHAVVSLTHPGLQIRLQVMLLLHVLHVASHSIAYTS